MIGQTMPGSDFLQYGAMGLLALVLAGSGYGIHKLAMYCISDVWNPIMQERNEIARQLADDQKKCNAAITAGIESMAETYRQVNDRLDEHGKQLGEQGRRLDEHGNHLEQILRELKG